MPIFTKVGSSHKLVLDAWVKHEGSWKPLDSIHYKSGRSWKLVHTPLRPFSFTETLTGTVYNYNLRQRALASGWNPAQPLVAAVNLNACKVLSLVDGGYAFTTGVDFPSGSSLTLSISSDSKIIGKGGRGGRGGGPTSASVGGAGGPAVFLNLPTVLNNLGIIAGGGGAGGGGGFAQVFSSIHQTLVTEGMGGAPGAGYGVGGVRGDYNYSNVQQGGSLTVVNSVISTPSTIPNATETATFVYAPAYEYEPYRGANWEAGSWGLYGYGDDVYYRYQCGGRGGQGGLLGSPGTAGSAGLRLESNVPGFTQEYQEAGAPGGAGGKSIVGFSLCTVTNLGTLYGETL